MLGIPANLTVDPCIWLCWMQYAAFHLGNEVLCISKPKDVLAVKGQQQIYEMQLIKVYSHRCKALLPRHACCWGNVPHLR